MAVTRGPAARIAATAATLLGVTLLGACKAPSGAPAASSSSSAAPAPSAVASPSAPAPEPASLAGGACLLLDYGVINKTLGTNFDVAASADKSDSYTCVVQSSTASYPDLTLAITATDLTVSDFQSDVAPKGSKKVSNLGKVGYEVEHDATSGAGPSIEVGWLSGNERLIVMTFAYAKGATADADMVSKLDDLARSVDAATV